MARIGFEVTLVERERFPRHKLCGEFISPECLKHFDELGVLPGLLAAGGEPIHETRFYDRRGNSFGVSSRLLDEGGFALSLSRSEMDDRLLRCAQDAGVEVCEGTAVTGVEMSGGRISEVVLKNSLGERRSVKSDLFVDATGRAGMLSKLAGRHSGSAQARPNAPVAVGFKTHLEGARTAPGTCEIFFFPGGYGGLTPVENGLTNLCFLVDARLARRLGGAADDIVRGALHTNVRAAHALEHAKPVFDWLAVSISSFGRSRPLGINNLFSVGDSAAFIDPFTGSGMLMALESSSMLAKAAAAVPADEIGKVYESAYEKQFTRRLRICSVLRRAAFLPMLPTLAIMFLSSSKPSRGLLARLTRPERPVRPEIS